MATIDDLARVIRDRHGIDSLDAARESVTVLVDQIADDPDLWDRGAQTLTAAGVDLVTDAVAQSYSIGAVASAAAQMLVEIEEAEARRQHAESEAKRHAEARDKLIRAALRTELPRKMIAAAAGVKEPRLYQIRDGRR